MIHLLGVSWPGNVRELQNTLTWVALTCWGGLINVEDFVFPIPSSDGVSSPREVDRACILDALELMKWNRRKVCKLLGISPPTLRRKICEYGLVLPTPS